MNSRDISRVPSDITFYLICHDVYFARLQVRGSSYVLLKGSEIAKTESPAFHSKIAIALRHNPQYINNFIVLQDISYDNPSLLASVVAGANKNGYSEWIDESKRTLDFYLTSGCAVLPNRTQQKRKVDLDDGLYYLHRVSRISGNKLLQARMQVTDGSYIVLAGSTISSVETAGVRSEALIKRHDSTVVQDEIVISNVPFTSSSQAGQFVCGTSLDGPSVWKKQIEQKR